MANDYTANVLEVLSGELPALRNRFTLASRVYNHNRNGYNGRGSARWTRQIASAVETKTEGTALSRSADSSIGAVTLTPATHKVARFNIEDGELSISSVRTEASQKIPFNLIALVKAIETSIAALQSSLVTNRIGTLGGGVTRPLLARAATLLEKRDTVAETLILHPDVKEGMLLDDNIQKLFTYWQQGNAGVGSFVPNMFNFGAVGSSNQIYSPEAGQFVCMAMARPCIGIAFGDLSGVDAGAGRFVRSLPDEVTGITFRVVQHATSDGLGQEFILDVQYDVEMQEEALGVAILS